MEAKISYLNSKDEDCEKIIDLELAKCLNKGDIIHLIDEYGEEIEPIVDYRWFSFENNKLIIQC